MLMISSLQLKLLTTDARDVECSKSSKTLVYFTTKKTFACASSEKSKQRDVNPKSSARDEVNILSKHIHRVPFILRGLT